MFKAVENWWRKMEKRTIGQSLLRLTEWFGEWWGQRIDWTELKSIFWKIADWIKLLISTKAWRRLIWKFSLQVPKYEKIREKTVPGTVRHHVNQVIQVSIINIRIADVSCLLMWSSEKDPNDLLSISAGPWCRIWIQTWVNRQTQIELAYTLKRYVTKEKGRLRYFLASFRLKETKKTSKCNMWYWIRSWIETELKNAIEDIVGTTGQIWICAVYQSCNSVKFPEFNFSPVVIWGHPILRR